MKFWQPGHLFNKLQIWSDQGFLSKKIKLQIIIALSVLVAFLSGYTAAYRYYSMTRSQKPLQPQLVSPGPIKQDSKIADKELTQPQVIVTRAPQPAPSDEPPSLDIAKAKTTKDTRTLLARNILFTHVNYRAKEVFIAGEFNSWELHKMQKEKLGVWRARLAVQPGAYKYNFIVDGKKKFDQYNPKREAGYSILIVEPLE